MRYDLFFSKIVGREDVVELLIDNGSDFKEFNDNQQTPLHKAAQQGTNQNNSKSNSIKLSSSFRSCGYRTDASRQRLQY